ncbi:hypothetical protein [Kitasatospora sp. NPDC088346]|uniref:hypothetical protein n=1 Tax=Kitasatospora sp. NPDC088346 TaxID=3364073 RepID=UPI0038041360
MLTLSLATILEEALSEHKNLTGNISDIEELLKPENLARVQELAKVFAFLAFHPAADAGVCDYVRSGTLADDSGPDVLALFNLEAPAPTPTPVGDQAFAAWLQVDSGTHPSYRMVHDLFAEASVPPLPGLLFFYADWASKTGAVYVPLGGAEAEADVRTLARQVFAMAAKVADPADSRKALDRLCVALSKERIDYRKTRRASMKEWLITSFRFVTEHGGDIVSAVGLIV